MPFVIDELKRHDSPISSEAIAHELVEKSWTVVEKELEPSHATLMLRVFSWFVLERRC